MNVAAIPAELRERDQWVLWRYDERDDDITKVPYRVREPFVRASSTDSTTWTTFAAAVAAAPQFSGIGFVFAKDDPYCGVDLDRCRRDLSDLGGPLLEPWAASLVLMLDSYTEWSPSRNGVHVIVRGGLVGRPGRRTGQVEVYSAGRYFCMTGAHLQGTPLEVR